jgi:hypothetical protein
MPTFFLPPERSFEGYDGFSNLNMLRSHLSRCALSAWTMIVASGGRDRMKHYEGGLVVFVREDVDLCPEVLDRR